MSQTTNGTTVEIDWWVDFDDHIAGESPAAAIKDVAQNVGGD